MGAVLANNVKKKSNTERKQIRTNIWYIIHSIVLQSLKNYHLTLCTKPDWFLKKINKFKTVDLQTNENRVLKPKVLDNVGDLFNELYDISIDKYNEEKDGLNKKKQNNFTTKNWDLLMIISTSLKKKKKKKEKDQQTSKRPHKKEPPKKLTKDNLSKLNEWVNRKETDINFELFKKNFNFQRPSDMLKAVYTTNDKK